MSADQAAKKDSRDFCVRQYGEELRALEKENFNLKLKLFNLQQMKKEPRKEGNESQCNDIAELQMENKRLQEEQAEQLEIMRESLTCINMLEKKYEEKRKFGGAEVKRLQEWFRRAKAREESSSHGKHSQRRICQHNCWNLRLLRRARETSSAVDKGNSAAKKLETKPADEDLISKAQQEHTRLKHELLRLNLKVVEIEYENENLQKVISEQADLIKALKKSVDLVKGEVCDYKMKLEFDPTSYEKTIDLNNISSDCRLPFQNPLFGSFHSDYNQ